MSIETVRLGTIMHPHLYKEQMNIINAFNSAINLAAQIAASFELPVSSILTT